MPSHPDARSDRIPPCCEETEARCEAESDMWAGEWTKLLGMTAAALNAADAMMDAMRGDLGPEFKGKTSREAAPEIARRVQAWTDARKALVLYARDAQGQLTEASNAA